MSRRAIWLTVFLTTTVAAVGEELWAALDTSPTTVPWTSLVVDNVPMWIGLPIVIAFAVWLPIHFYIYWRRKQSEKRHTPMGK